MMPGRMGEGSACARYAPMLATFAGRSRRDASRTRAERQQFREVREHLSDCGSCRRIAGEFLQAGKALRQAAVARAQIGDVPFETMHADIMERIAAMTVSDASAANEPLAGAGSVNPVQGNSVPVSSAVPDSSAAPVFTDACGSTALSSSTGNLPFSLPGGRAVGRERWAMMVAAAAVLLLLGFWWSGRPSAESIWDRPPSPTSSGGQSMSAAPYSALPYSGQPAQVRPAGLEQAGGAERGIGPGMMGRGTMRWFVDVQPAVYLKLVEPLEGEREVSAGGQSSEQAAPSASRAAREQGGR